MINAKLGEKIKTLRKINGLTQAEFAEQIGIEVLHLSNVERNRKNFSIDKLKVISKKFGVKMSYLTAGYFDNDADEIELEKEMLIEELLEELKELDIEGVKMVMEDVKYLADKKK